MTTRLILRGDVILEDDVLTDHLLVCIDGTIEEITPASGYLSLDNIVDCRDCYIAPGFIDMHVHGGSRADYMDGNTNAVITANQCHARHGTTTLFPTTTTGSFSQLDEMVTACKSVQASWEPKHGARVAGVHFYGPYFAADKVGCHSPAGRRDPDPEEYRYFLSKEIVKIATCASELPGAIGFYQKAELEGCFITCGHSNACWEELEEAFAAGMRHVDHFWCAMSSVSSLRQRFGMPMRAGMEQFVLANKSMSTEVLADGKHLSDNLLNFAFQMIGSDQLCLVTDANRAMDAPPGRYRFGSEVDGTWVTSDGDTVRGEDGGLASSLCGMDTMIKNMRNATGASIEKIVRMASAVPAKLTGIADRCGSIEVGKQADLIVLSRELDVQSVYINGKQFC